MPKEISSFRDYLIRCGRRDISLFNNLDKLKRLWCVENSAGEHDNTNTRIIWNIVKIADLNWSAIMIWLDLRSIWNTFRNYLYILNAWLLDVLFSMYMGSRLMLDSEIFLFFFLHWEKGYRKDIFRIRRRAHFLRTKVLGFRENNCL